MTIITINMLILALYMDFHIITKIAISRVMLQYVIQKIEFMIRFMFFINLMLSHKYCSRKTQYSQNTDDVFAYIVCTIVMIYIKKINNAALIFYTKFIKIPVFLCKAISLFYFKHVFFLWRICFLAWFFCCIIIIIFFFQKSPLTYLSNYY